MLTYTDKKPASGTMDRQVKYMAMGICRMWPELEDFERLFTLKLSEMPRLNHIHPQFAYKLIRHDRNTMEVWHVDQVEMIHDRLLLVVEYTSDIDIDLAMVGKGFQENEEDFNNAGIDYLTLIDNVVKRVY